MPLLNKRNYIKKKPFRDAKIYVLICEGGKTEPQYFGFFDGLSSKLQLYIVPSKNGKSLPGALTENALGFVKEVNTDEGDYELWFILDMDKWEPHLHGMQKECNEMKYWNTINKLLKPMPFFDDLDSL